MGRADEKGYDKFSHIGKNFFKLLEAIRTLPDNKIVYLMHHIEVNDMDGREKAKTVGKMVDNYIVIEGCFAIVLKAVADNKGYFFRTKTNGVDPVKAPINMFSDEQIDNDLLMVDNIIREFYGITEKEKTDGEQTE